MRRTQRAPHGLGINGQKDYGITDNGRTMSTSFVQLSDKTAPPSRSGAPLPLSPWMEDPLSFDDAAYEAW
eukprot:5405576-Lingulodinium_polyedra.AAC.1